ncbi:MAG: DUF262 domain-containing HNH endonuclease family protein [Methanobrevibacter sp.]|nr:DUF262 domain-containing HNH endonuclease family protein [Methanobrevibacter sp.]
MNKRNEPIREVTIKELFSSEEYQIPIYQRNYAWGESEIIQLIQDIADYSKKNSENYYIGNLIVFKKQIGQSYTFEIIDGQQRLTTLTILLSVLKDKFQDKFNDNIDWYKLNFHFESRKISTDTLKILYEGKYDTLLKRTDLVYNTDITHAYEIILKGLNRILKETSQNMDDFYNYLINKVSILRVPVPDDTDLNHYFEIMNTRGEQLEKQEILKAKCIANLKEDKDRYIFSLIWEACSNMEKYVQSGFSDTTVRKKIFGKDWNRLEFEDFDSLSKKLAKNVVDDDSSTIIEYIINDEIMKSGDENDSNEFIDRFTSVINFSNFLLQILRIQTKGIAPLDDKNLLEIFDKHLNSNEEVKEFGFNLLKGKFLFDKFVIKREYLKGIDNWSLKKFVSQNKGNYVNTYSKEDEGANKKILMILSMFQATTPGYSRKDWLNATLKYLFEQHEKIIPEKYIEYLEGVAKSFLFDRFIAKEPLDYYEIIYKNNGVPQNNVGDLDLSKLDSGTAVENFIFNYLDFLLWNKNKYSSFEFNASRNSIEHFYPQMPMEGFESLADNCLHNFGNLCIITREKNSSLRNFMPKTKIDFYEKNHNKNNIDSIKQKLMMDITRNGRWSENEIKKHGDEMKKVLISS